MLKYKNLPNLLTILRILIIPVIVLSFYFDDVVFAHKISSILFLFASITDFLDGYIARKYNLESVFGKILDPIADKVLVGSILIMLVKFNKASEIPCLLILARELIISGVREFIARAKITVPVSSLAKVKTLVQMTAIFALLIGSKGSGIELCDQIGNVLLWIAVALTIITSISYLKVILSTFKATKHTVM
jgi:CDP-diacylglycerol--glycerol-3-phosphate 3-phosphatidyltransferase